MTEETQQYIKSFVSEPLVSWQPDVRSLRRCIEEYEWEGLPSRQSTSST
jgi:hypothetical protein